MKRLQIWAPLVVIGLIAGVVALNHGYRKPPPNEVRLDCPNLQAGCKATLGERELAFGVSGDLKMLNPFQLWAKVDGAKAVQASFDMVGMDMGFNLYTLRPDGSGAYRVQVTLPMCVTGRRDWLLHLDVDGQRFTVPFVTEM